MSNRPGASYEQLLDAVPIPIFVVDGEGVIAYCNRESERLLGWPGSEIVGQPYVRFVPASEEEALLARNREVVAHPESSGTRATAVRADGSHVPVEAHSGVLQTETGPRVVYAIRDLTPQLQREREREQLERNLRRATGGEAIDPQLGQTGRLETVGQLAGGIAHDFNNILGVIINYSQFVMDELEEGSSARADVEEIWRAARRGAALTRQLTIFSRHESQTLEAIDLNNVVTELEALLMRTLGEHIELRTKLGDELWAIEADRGQIEQALVNLALNSRDAMPDGGTLTITTENVELDEREASLYPSIEPGRFVRLSVEDTGVGMDGEVAARAFEPFYTTKAQGEGTGLGLAIVYGIVTSAGGAVALSSEPGFGTVVSAHFPARRPVAPGVAGEAESKAAAAPEMSASILVVEDDPSMRRMAERILRRSGYEVSTAPSGRDALRKLEDDGQFDLLLTDVVMPEISGNELAGRAAALYPELRILLMSGYVDRPGAGPVEEDSVLLEKPFRAEDLLGKVREVLEAEPRPAP